MYNQWRRFQFFDKELVTADAGGDAAAPHPELQKLKVTAVASGKDGLLQMRGYPKRVPWPSGAKQQAIADQLWEQSLRSCDLADPLVMATP